MAKTRTLLPGGSGLDGLVRRTVLPGGLRILSEAVPGVRSVSFGLWVDVGSRDETPALAGASHYLEHLLFKGTARRDALAIAAELEEVGGEANAFTAKEQTCFYAKVLDTDLPLAIDINCDMIASSLIKSADVESERSVVLDELAMHDDDPSDVVHDEFSALVFGDGPLGKPILGTVDSMTGMSRARVAGWWRKRYVAPSIVVTAAGAVDHADLVRRVTKAFAGTGLLDTSAPPADLRPDPEPGTTVAASPRVAVFRRPTEQASIVLGGPGLARRDPRRFAFSILMNALGGGMSSRLFQEIREKRGLAYGVYSFSSAYSDAGLWGVSAGCAPKSVRSIVELTREQCSDVAAHGITAVELARAQGQLRGGLILGLEDTGARMDRLGKAELVYGELLSSEQVLARIAAVTLDEVAAVAADVLSRPLSLAVVGPVRADEASYAKMVA